ncbi:MAG: SDR family oxidoreductase [Syntrophobacteraceae bacterium]
MCRRNINIFLTGGTGLIGRHILYELIKLYIDETFNGKIYLSVRKKENANGVGALKGILQHRYLPNYLRHYKTDHLFNIVEEIETDLRSRHLKDKLELMKGDNVYVIHAAASTNLLSDERAESDIYFNNYVASLNLLESVMDYACKFVYISTAFSCGIRKGLLSDSYLSSPRGVYRNPYERYKSAVEDRIVQRCSEKSLDWQILRPGVVCGRLIDEPLYYTSKFDVFYGWGRFFHKYRENLDEYVRIYLNENAGLNILPVDYVAKAVVNGFLTDRKELNIVHSCCTPHTDYLCRILNEVGFKNYEFIDGMPTDPNRLEKLYYRTAGSAFTPYISSPPHEYNVGNLKSIMNGVEEPTISTNISELMSFAIDHGFQPS